MDLSWISALAPWLLTRETALLLVGGFVVGIFSVIFGGGFFISNLAVLGPRDFALLEPHLQIVPIARGEFLHLPGDEIKQVYFLHSGIVCLMAISDDGNAISTASVGSEGAIGTIAGTGFVRAFTRALVQAPGIASKISVPHLRRAVSKSEAISDVLTRNAQPRSRSLASALLNCPRFYSTAGLLQRRHLPRTSWRAGQRRVKTELRPLVSLAAAPALPCRLFALGDRRRNSLSFIERQANHCIARLCRKNS